jgi:hypothetical protein
MWSWDRTPDLLNAMQPVRRGKTANTRGPPTYETHTYHILHAGVHIFHRSRPVPCPSVPSVPTRCRSEGGCRKALRNNGFVAGRRMQPPEGRYAEKAGAIAHATPGHTGVA